MMRLSLRTLPDPVVFMIALLASQQFAAVGQIPLADEFETDPLLSGWTRSGPGAEWTMSEAASAAHSLAAQTDSWSSPMLDTEPLQWYRLSFKSKAPGTVTNIGSIGYAFWSAVFYDANGVQLMDDQYASVLQSSDWVANEARIRAKHRPGPSGTLLPVRMKISFHPIGAQSLFIDDVVLESTSIEEVASWADNLYEGLPARLDYVPKANRWERIPRTMEKLRSGKTLRIVMLGDSVQADTANSPIDAFLQRAYPGSRVELISSTRGGTGVWYFMDHVAEYITDYLPDLLVIGGISQPDDMTPFQSVVNQVRAHDMLKSRTTEILLLTKAWSSNNNFGNYFLAPGMRELNQDPSLNPSVPENYRGHLLSFAYANDLEFLDMTGIAAEFIYGPATVVGVGAPANPNGDPYSFWLRDWVHSNDYGKQILGRELEIYFAPPPSLAIERTEAGSLVLSWPGFANGYTLEAADDLESPTSWYSVNQTPALTNGRRWLPPTIPSGTVQQFYRIKKP